MNTFPMIDSISAQVAVGLLVSGLLIFVLFALGTALSHEKGLGVTRAQYVITFISVYLVTVASFLALRSENPVWTTFFMQQLSSVLLTVSAMLQLRNLRLAEDQINRMDGSIPKRAPAYHPHLPTLTSIGLASYGFAGSVGSLARLLGGPVSFV